MYRTIDQPAYAAHPRRPISAADWADHCAALASVGCEMEITRSYYRQVINSNGTTERKLVLTMRNVGATRCSGEPTVTRI